MVLDYIKIMLNFLQISTTTHLSVFTLIPFGPTSRAKLFVNISIAALITTQIPNAFTIKSKKLVN